MKHVHINRQNTAVWSAIFWPLQYQLNFRINHLFTPSRIGLPRLSLFNPHFMYRLKTKQTSKMLVGKCTHVYFSIAKSILNSYFLCL